MKYRELTNADLSSIQRDINQAVFWQQYVDFAAKWFTGAVRMECETHGEYNDEGGTDYSVSSITVYGADGVELEPNFQEDDHEYDYEDERHGLPIADEDEYSFTVDLTQQPIRPRIAIIEDE